VRHHELVLEAATILCDRLRRDLSLAFDREQVLVGAALHDAGKILHPEEMSAPGSQHELAGKELLTNNGVDANARTIGAPCEPGAARQRLCSRRRPAAAICDPEPKISAIRAEAPRSRRRHAAEPTPRARRRRAISST
jgi:hypothetical protein